MKCHILFSEKNKKNISKCRLLKILPRVLSVKGSDFGTDRVCFWIKNFMLRIQIHVTIFLVAS